MDFTTLFSGPAQAGSSALPGAALAAPAAGAGAAQAGPTGAGADGDFASLVALALGQLGAPAAADGQAEPIAGRAKPKAEATAALETEPAETPSEGPDAATLAVLVALATPQAIAMPAAADVPVATGTGGSPAATAPIDSRPVTSATDADAASAPPPAFAPMAADAGPAFTEALDVAEQPRAPAAPAPAPADTPTIEASTPHDGASRSAGDESQSTPVAPAAIRSEASAGDAVSAPAADPGPSPASTPVADGRPEAVPASPTQRPAAAPGRDVRSAAQQIRQVLAAAAAAAPDAARPAAPVGPASPAVATQAPAAVGVQTQVAGASAPETAPAVGRSATVAVPTVAVPAAASGSESRGDAETSGDRGGERAAPAPASPLVRTVPAADLRFDPAPGVSATPAPTAVAHAAPLAVASPMAAAETLRALELPASARLDQALATLDPETRNLQAIVRTVRLFTAGDGVSEARLRLEPDHLGPVGLTVRVEQGSVSAHFRAETPAAQRWIETHQQELRAGLREQGLEVKDVVVTTDPDGRRDRRQEGQPARPARQRRTADADAPRFEVIA